MRHPFAVRYTLAVLAIAGLMACDGSTHADDGVAIVDVNAVARALGRDDVIEQRIVSANQQLTSQLLQVAQSLQQQLEALQQDAGQDEEARQQLAQATVKANQQLKQTQRAAQQQLEQYRAGVVSEFLGEVRPHAAEIARQRGAKLVLTAAANLIWFDAIVDITDEVIAAMRARANTDPGEQAGLSP